MTNNKYWIYLKNLKRSSKTNIFGAAKCLMREFELSNNEANEILVDWMKNYNPNDYKEVK